MISVELQRIIHAKNSVRESIVAKGVEVPDSALLDEYAEYIDKIEQGGGGGGEIEYAPVCFTNTSGSENKLTVTYARLPRGQYSLDGKSWTDMPESSQVLGLLFTDKIYVRSPYVVPSSSTLFSSTKTCVMSGDLNSICYGTQDYVYNYAFQNIVGDTNIILGNINVDLGEIANQYVCSRMFFRNKATSDFSGVKVTGKAGNNALEYAFAETNMTTPPDVSGVTIAGTYVMSYAFYKNTSLARIPKLPSNDVTDYCYYYAFSESGITRIEEGELPTKVAQYCFSSMFHKCTKLTYVADVLTATTLVASCYRLMFYGCTALTEAPEIHATTGTNGSCYRMFMSCTGLEKAKTIHIEMKSTAICTEMFSGCTKLSEVTVTSSTWTAQTNWLNNVASAGTFTKPAGTTIATGTNGIPSDWTVVNV